MRAKYFNIVEHPENNPEYAGLIVNDGVAPVSNINPYLQRGRFARRKLTASDYVEGILKGNVTVLGQAVTLVESTVPEHQQMAQEVIEKCLPHSGRSIRVGISGVPGAGKSTSIDEFGIHLLKEHGGKLAVTHYRVVQRSRRYSLLELQLDTGRRNQIRVHLREEKHPVVHDPLYGYKDDVSPIARLALHAFRLAFVHPVTGKRLRFETPYPPSFLKLMEL